MTKCSKDGGDCCGCMDCQNNETTKNEIKNSLAFNIERLRNQFGLSQRKLASNIGVAPSTVNRWEHEEAIPTAIHLYLMAKHYEISLAEFFN